MSSHNRRKPPRCGRCHGRALAVGETDLAAVWQCSRCEHRWTHAKPSPLIRRMLPIAQLTALYQPVEGQMTLNLDSPDITLRHVGGHACTGETCICKPSPDLDGQDLALQELAEAVTDRARARAALAASQAAVEAAMRQALAAGVETKHVARVLGVSHSRANQLRRR